MDVARYGSLGGSRRWNCINCATLCRWPSSRASRGQPSCCTSRSRPSQRLWPSSRGSVRSSPFTILWALNKLYPDLYSEKELAEDIAYFYETFFDTELTDDEVAAIIDYSYSPAK